jgi:hypothetical protein
MRKLITMDQAEALAVAHAELAELRKATYSQLVERLIDKQKQALWDDKSKVNLRVIVSIDDGGWRAYSPLGVDFIRAPDGSFVGE